MSNDLQRDLSQKTRLQIVSILVFIVAISTIAAMTYVQTVLVPGFVEIAVRACTNLGGLIAVPLLLILGFRDWLITSKTKLPAWRNGLALSLMVVPSLVWLSRISMSVVSAGLQPINHFPHVDLLGLLATLLSSNGPRHSRHDNALYGRNSSGTGRKTVPIGAKWSSQSSLIW